MCCNHTFRRSSSGCVAAAVAIAARSQRFQAPPDPPPRLLSCYCVLHRPVALRQDGLPKEPARHCELRSPTTVLIFPLHLSASLASAPFLTLRGSLLFHFVSTTLSRRIALFLSASDRPHASRESERRLLLIIPKHQANFAPSPTSRRIITRLVLHSRTIVELVYLHRIGASPAPCRLATIGGRQHTPQAC